MGFFLRTGAENEKTFVHSLETLTCLGGELDMGFVKVALVKDLEPGNMIGVAAERKEIVVANVDCDYFAIGNRCTHMSCMLSHGSVKGQNVTCSCHGSVFDLKTGNVVKGPARKAEPVFPVKSKGDQILVNI
jgi:3-phenylpropionate/trans-cinnamate dioxygenase ferredoxin subunit